MSLANHICVYNKCKMNVKSCGDISFFRFPVNDPDRAEIWQRNCGNSQVAVMDLDELKNKLICEHHFHSSLIIKNARRKLLRKDAVPNMYLKRTPDKMPPKKFKQQPQVEVQKVEVQSRSRRQASKEALKQLQKISETELTEQAVETMILSDDDEVQISNDILPVRKVCTCGAFAKSGYQCSICKTIYHTSCRNRMNVCCPGADLESTLKQPVTPNTSLTDFKKRPSKPTEEHEITLPEEIEPGENLSLENAALTLRVWQENMSPAQVAYQAKRDREFTLMNEKIDSLLKTSGAEVIFQGDSFSAFKIEGPPTCLPAGSSTPVPLLKPITPAKPLLNTTVAPSTPPATTAAQSPVGLSFVVDPRSGQVVGTVSANSHTLPATSRKRGRFSAPLPTGPQTKIAKIGISNVTAPSSPAVVSAKPVEPPAPPQKTPNGNSSAVTKTPTAAPSLAVVDLTADETVNNKPSADTKEVAFNKIQGKTFPSLVVVARPSLNVPPVASPLERSKLDMRVKSILVYQPSKFTEWLIQQGLVKSEQYCTVHVMNKLKLGMYSDAAKFPFSGGYVWISDCCPQRFISVFCGSIFEGSPHPPSVIIKLMYHWSCQTNVQNVIQWVKVENLYVKGLYTWLRAVCTVGLHSHLEKLGGPGVKVEIGVISLGTTSQHQRQVKVEVLGILETESKRIRLRAVEPLTDSDKNYKKRFSKILEPLFAWVHPESVIVTDQTVDKGTLHSMGFITVQHSIGGTGNHRIMDYLRKIVPRMFQNTLSLLSRQIIQQFLDELVWREWFGTTPAEAFDNIILHLSEQTRSDGRQALMIKLNKVATNPFKNWSINHLLTPAAEEPQLPVVLEPPAKRMRRNNKSLAKPQSPTPELLKPAKPMSPDFPELMVPLENYYYGTIDGVSRLDPVNLNIKCHLCKENFTNNILLMKHYFMHAHKTECNFQCHYCLASISSRESLQAHIQEKHLNTTKVGQEFACIICETLFPSSYQLGKHMSTEHLPAELPYQCGSCTFRCSCHKEAIDHFHSVHNNQGVIQCPFCLKSSVVATANRNIPVHLQYFFQHLQKHQRKPVAKKCKKCALWFIHKELINTHMRMHESQKRCAGLRPWPIQQSGVTVPKSVTDYGEEEEVIDIANLVIKIPDDSVCKECSKKLTSTHYEALLSCSNENCQYVTCCKKAMDKHANECKDFKLSLPQMQLPFEMFCVCGYKDGDGNSMAKHLAVCERNSAYPSSDAAKAATVTHSMLDVLGLVRRPEEPAQTTDSDGESNKKEAVPGGEEKTESEEVSDGKPAHSDKAETKDSKTSISIDSDEGEESSNDKDKNEDSNDKNEDSNDKNEDSNDKNEDSNDKNEDTNSEKNDSEKNDEEAAPRDRKSSSEIESEEVQNDKESLSDKNEDEQSSTEKDETSPMDEDNASDNEESVEKPDDVLTKSVLSESPEDGNGGTEKMDVNKEIIENLEELVGSAQNDQIMETDEVDGLLNNIMDTECQKNNDLSEVLLAN